MTPKKMPVYAEVSTPNRYFRSHWMYCIPYTAQVVDLVVDLVLRQSDSSSSERLVAVLGELAARMSSFAHLLSRTNVFALQMVVSRFLGR